MKKLLFALVITSTLWSCGKDGEIGPKGDKGEQGEKGSQGEKGLDGTTLLSGNGSPQLTIGKVGDYYIDLSTSNLYGPKTSTSWGQSTSMKGDKGDNGVDGSNGKDGSKILSGDGGPSMSIGSLGDYYFSKTSLMLWGPKTSTGWGESILLGYTQKTGLQIYLIRNVKFTIPASSHLEFNNTKPWFYYIPEEINMGNTNIKKGMFFMYWRYNHPENDNNVHIGNYFDHSWFDLTTNGPNENIQVGNNKIQMRLDQHRIGRNPIKGAYVLQPILVGGAYNQHNGPMDINEFYNFREGATFDILIKYIPESIAIQMSAKGKNPQSLLKF